MKYFVLLLCLFPSMAFASGLSGGSGLSNTSVSCTSVSTSSGASPQTATCPAGYYITGASCVNATAATACQISTVVGGIGGAATVTSSAGNISVTAYCCH